MNFSIKSLVQEFLYEPAENAIGDVDRAPAMHTSPADTHQTPCPTLFEIIALNELEAQDLHSGIQYWRQLCGKRSFPRREDLKPRGMAGLLRNTVLVKVLAGGGDYEYRIVGDAVACAYGGPLQNHRLSDFETTAPTTVQTMLSLFGTVVESGKPLAARCRTGHDTPEANFVAAETVLLPLGAHDHIVDHLLTFSSYA